MAASVQDFNVHTDVDASDCTRGLYGQRKALKAEFLVFFLIFFLITAPGTRTRVSNAPAVSVGRCTS